MPKRKILPRKDSSKYDSLSFGTFPDNENLFNDQRTMIFTSSILDMPTGLPKDYSTTFRGSETYGDLVSSSSIYITGNIKSPIFDHFMRIDPNYSSSSEPFKEVSQFEQGKFSDPFYATGSAGFVGDGSFSTPLKDKVKINLSFPISQKTTMLAKTSSIYYLNTKQSRWEIPQNATADHVGPWEKICYGANAWYYTSPSAPRGSFFPEDQIGFNQYGHSITSGSLNKFRGADTQFSDWVTRSTQSDYLLGETFYSTPTANQLYELMTKNNEKTLTLNQDYNANDEQLFELPINQPFLIEKIVYEIPMMLGQDWFNDSTVVANPITSSYVNGSYTIQGGIWPGGMPGGLNSNFYDMGGPGITVALFSQVNQGIKKIRDLIANDVITHSNDVDYNINTRTPAILARNFLDGMGGIEKVGGVVAYTNNSFTGSVFINSKAKISNGITNRALFVGASFDWVNPFYIQQVNNKNPGLTPGSTGEDHLRFFREIEKLLIKESNVCRAFYDPVGRSGSGFSPSGGSIFGGEYALPQNSVFSSGYLTNPVSEMADEDFEKLITGYKSQIYYFLGLQDLQFWMPTFERTERISPYLVQPGQKLLISISKTRPAYKGANVQTTPTDILVGRVKLMAEEYEYVSRAGHDVQLNTGSINITIYGSYVKNGSSYIP